MGYIFGVNNHLVLRKMQKQSGTATNPISIDEEDAAANERELFIDAARNKAIIQEAEIISDPLSLCCAVVKTCIRGELAVKQRELNKVIKDYFTAKLSINIKKEHFQPKIDPDYSDPSTLPNPCELILYGADFLTTKHIVDRFAIIDTQIREIVWLNDSSCKLVYGSPNEAELFLQNQGVQVKVEEDVDQLPRGICFTSAGWLQIKSYMIFSFERQLWVRYATSKESEMLKEKKNFYEKFAAAKAQLGRYLLEKFNAVDKYRILVEQIQRKKLAQRRPDHGLHHSRTRTRDKNRNHSRFGREFVGDRMPHRFNQRNRYNDNQFEMKEVKNIKYGHRPDKMNESFDRISRRVNDRRQNLDTSFNYNRAAGQEDKNIQYLDYQGCSENADTDFPFKPNSKLNLSRQNLSFRLPDNINKKACFDAFMELDSQIQFNNFGSVHKVNHKQDLPDQDVDLSFVFDREEGSGPNNNTSFQVDPNRIQANHSFVMVNSHQPNSDFNQSFIINPLPIEQGKEKKDFFQQLYSVVSSVREVNQAHEINELSFVYNPDKKKQKQSRQLSENFSNTDSY